MFVYVKHLRPNVTLNPIFLDKFVSPEENEVLWIQFKTFHFLCNVQLDPISQSVRPLQAFVAKCNVTI